MDSLPFSDLKLVLRDDTEELIINVHKVLLFSASTYFRILLTKFAESQNANNIIYLTVPHTRAAANIIDSFYHRPINMSDARHNLKLIQCFDFFGVDIPADLIHHTVVDPVDFNTVCQLANSLSIQDATKLICSNISHTDFHPFRLINIPAHLMIPTYRMLNSFSVILKTATSFKLYNPITNRYYWKIKIREHLISYDISLAKMELALLYHNQFDQPMIALWNITHNPVLIKTLGQNLSTPYKLESDRLINIRYCQNDHYLLIMREKSISLYHITTEQQVKQMMTTPGCKCVILGENTHALYHSNYYTMLLDLRGNKNVYVIAHGMIAPINPICYTPTYDKIAIISYGYRDRDRDREYDTIKDFSVRIYETMSGQCLQSLQMVDLKIHNVTLSYVTCMNFSQTGKYIGFGGNDGLVIIYGVEAKNVLWIKQLDPYNNITNIMIAEGIGDDICIAATQYKYLFVIDLINKIEIGSNKIEIGSHASILDQIIGVCTKRQLIKKLKKIIDESPVRPLSIKTHVKN